MKRPIRTLFFGLTHEHASGKLATLAKMPEDFEIVAIVDDRATTTRPVFADHPASADGFRLITAEEAFARRDFDVACVETKNADLMSVAERLADLGMPMHCDKPCGESMLPFEKIVGKCRAAKTAARSC